MSVAFHYHKCSNWFEIYPTHALSPVRSDYFFARIWTLLKESTGEGI